MKTYCDISVHPDDQDKYERLHNSVERMREESIRWKGLGLPKIEVLEHGKQFDPMSGDTEKNSFCIYGALLEHEQKHKEQLKGPCESFYNCLKEETELELSVTEPNEKWVNAKQFYDCQKVFRAQRMSCKQSERIAYEAGIEYLEKILDPSREGAYSQSTRGCSFSRLEPIVESWKKLKYNPPECVDEESVWEKFTYVPGTDYC